jgi:putative hydrolase of the HAD superfamily
MNNSRFKVLFTDIGGVIATNGWDSALRARVIKHFHLDPEETASRHNLVFDSYERGHMTFEDYLRWTIFYKPRPFTVEEARSYVYEQGKLLPGTYEMYRKVKADNGIKLAMISNEGSGLTQHRVARFKLRELADFMVFSCAVGMRKPDPDIWKLALALAQVSAEESIYIDDRKLFVEFAAELGFTAHHHVSSDRTAAWLASLGLLADLSTGLPAE